MEKSTIGDIKAFFLKVKSDYERRLIEQKREGAATFLKDVVTRIDEFQLAEPTKPSSRKDILINDLASQSVQALYACHNTRDRSQDLTVAIPESAVESILSIWEQERGISGNYRRITDKAYRVAKKGGQPLRPIRILGEIIRKYPDKFSQKLRIELADNFVNSLPTEDWIYGVPEQTAKNIDYFLGVDKDARKSLADIFFEGALTLKKERSKDS